MRHRKNPINKYFLYDILGIAAYGSILYFGFIWLAGLSVLYAYLWNFALIILAVAFESYAEKFLQSDNIIAMYRKKYGTEKAYLMIAGGWLSFKTLIYSFYLIILIASRIIDFNPALVSENLADFVLSNNYSILFLLAFDTLIGQFSKDREKTKGILSKLDTEGEDDA